MLNSRSVVRNPAFRQSHLNGTGRKVNPRNDRVYLFLREQGDKVITQLVLTDSADRIRPVAEMTCVVGEISGSPTYLATCRKHVPQSLADADYIFHNSTFASRQLPAIKNFISRSEVTAHLFQFT